MLIRRNVPAAMAALSLVAGAASAGIVVYTNPSPGQPGHYDWRWQSTPEWASWLDITRPAHDQPNLAGPSSVGQLNLWSANVYVGTAQIIGLFGFVTYILPLDLNQPIVENLEWGFVESGFFLDDNGFSLFSESQPSYIGVRTVAGNYGWIQVIRTGSSLAALSWAYEAVPGVPIAAGQVPAPAAAAVLGLTVFAATKRRQRA